jgi:hypothetical protein
MDCNNGTHIPTNEAVEPCSGKYTNSDCTLFAEAITYLQLPANSTLTDVIKNLILSLADARLRITSLENE